MLTNTFQMVWNHQPHNHIICWQPHFVSCSDFTQNRPSADPVITWINPRDYRPVVFLKLRQVSTRKNAEKAAIEHVGNLGLKPSIKFTCSLFFISSCVFWQTYKNHMIWFYCYMTHGSWYWKMLNIQKKTPVSTHSTWWTWPFRPTLQKMRHPNTWLNTKLISRSRSKDATSTRVVPQVIDDDSHWSLSILDDIPRMMLIFHYHFLMVGFFEIFWLDRGQDEKILLNDSFSCCEM